MESIDKDLFPFDRDELPAAQLNLLIYMYTHQLAVTEVLMDEYLGVEKSTELIKKIGQVQNAARAEVVHALYKLHGKTPDV